MDSNNFLKVYMQDILLEQKEPVESELINSTELKNEEKELTLESFHWTKARSY